MNKKVKKILKWILVAVIILIIGFFYSFVRREQSISIVTENITAFKGQDIVYTFECKEDNLAGIELFFEQRTDNSGKITYVLQDEKGNDITDAESKKISSLKKDKHTLLKFDRIKDSKGRTYSIVVSCDNEEAKAVMLANDTEVNYSYIIWDIETMVVFCLGALYLVGLAKVLTWMFRK